MGNGVGRILRILANIVLLVIMFVVMYKISFSNLLDIRTYVEQEQSVFTLNGLIHFKSMIIAAVSVLFALAVLFLPTALNLLIPKKIIPDKNPT